MTEEEKEPRLGVDEMLAVINRAPDLFKALELGDKSWIGRDDVKPWTFNKPQNRIKESESSPESHKQS